jgi:hypothetical protein
MGKLGGIMGPTVEEAAVMAQEKSLSYPSFFMAGIITAPKLAVSEMAVPGDSGKKHGSTDVDIGKSTPNMPQKMITKIDDLIGQTPLVHQIPCDNKTRDTQ